MEAGGDFAGQAGLADPGFAGDEGEPEFPGYSLLPLLLHLTELTLPADEDATHPAQQRRQRDSRTRPRLPGHPEDRHDLAHGPPTPAWYAPRPADVPGD